MYKLIGRIFNLCDLAQLGNCCCWLRLFGCIVANECISLLAGRERALCTLYQEWWRMGWHTKKYVSVKRYPFVLEFLSHLTSYITAITPIIRHHRNSPASRFETSPHSFAREVPADVVSCVHVALHETKSGELMAAIKSKPWRLRQSYIITRACHHTVERSKGIKISANCERGSRRG